MKITIMGPPGCGKSTLAKNLAKALKLELHSVGDFRRKKGLEQGMSISEFNKLGEEEHWTDIEADKFAEEFAKKHDNIVVEGRMAWHFIPDSIKIYLDAREDVRAERIFSRNRESEPLTTLEETRKSMNERMNSDIKRYEKIYGINPYDKKHFDIVLDNSDQLPDVTLKQALDGIRNFKNIT